MMPVLGRRQIIHSEVCGGLVVLHIVVVGVLPPGVVVTSCW